MAGHSKFKNIMFRKGAQDKKRAKIFAKLGREIQIASKQGGDDPNSNHRLRTAIDAAKAANVPKDNIERAIKKASENDINNLEEKFDEVLCLNRHCCAFGDPSEVLTEEVIQEMYGSHNEMFKNHFKNNHRVTNDN